MGDEDGLSVRDYGQGGGVAPAIDSPRGRPHAVLVERADAVEVGKIVAAQERRVRFYLYRLMGTSGQARSEQPSRPPNESRSPF